MRSLPDPDLSLRDASDFIFDSALARKALRMPQPADLAVFLREIIQNIYKLTQSCHLPEFTDHGLGHLCSLIDRLSHWSVNLGGSAGEIVVEQTDFGPDKAAILLLATLLHDIGMLSQRAEDLEMPHSAGGNRSLQDVPTWVRSTHILRMERLTRRIFSGTSFTDDLDHPLVHRAFSVARAHGEWPWDWDRFHFQESDAGLAAMLAVSDLLDEDSLRCDSATLLKHRSGTSLNRAHWMRHGLTAGRVLVTDGRVRVSLARPPNTDAQVAPAFSALRNHYRLVMLYVQPLGLLNAGLLSVDFDPPHDLPSAVSPGLEGWANLPEFTTQSALVYHMLDSFMPEALLDGRRLDVATLARLSAINLQPVNLTAFYRIRRTMPPRTILERIFHALLGSSSH